MRCTANTFSFLVFFACTICVGQAANAQMVYGTNAYEVSSYEVSPSESGLETGEQIQYDTPAVSSVSPGVYPYVIARPADRAWIRQTPVEYRPNRPMHFWGNNVRRRSDVPASRVVIRNRSVGGLISRR